MKIEKEIKLDFSDVLIKPRKSNIPSRSCVSLSRTFVFKNGRKLSCIPIIAANMDGIGTFSMAKKLSEHHMMTALRKHYTADQFVNFYNNNNTDLIFYSFGLNDSDSEKLSITKKKIPNLNKVCIDVANGYSSLFVDLIKKHRDNYPDDIIMAGNVVSGEMTEELINAGVDIVKIGIGSGALCTTRVMAGVGIPQFSAILECTDSARVNNGYICSDGGIVNPGDLGKAFGAGADFVMLGSVLAGHYESDEPVYSPDKKDQLACSPSDYFSMANTYPSSSNYIKVYGMSSDTAQKKHVGEVKEYRSSEGRTLYIPYKGFVNNTVLSFLGGLRSTLTYTGSQNLDDLYHNTTFIQVNNQVNESLIKR